MPSIFDLITSLIIILITIYMAVIIYLKVKEAIERYKLKMGQYTKQRKQKKEDHIERDIGKTFLLFMIVIIPLFLLSIVVGSWRKHEVGTSP